MPPAGIDMSVIRDAMARRAQGNPVPAVAQMTQPGAALPTGGQNTPVPGPATSPVPNMPPHSIGAQPGAATPVQGAIKAASQANGPQFDDSTRLTAKALVSKLLQVM